MLEDHGQLQNLQLLCSVCSIPSLLRSMVLPFKGTSVLVRLYSFDNDGEEFLQNDFKNIYILTYRKY